MSDQQKNEIEIPANDILELLSSIQLASNRGAFRPEEFTRIGSAYESVVSFLTAIGVLKSPVAQNNN